MDDALSIIKDLLLKKIEPSEAYKFINAWIKRQTDQKEIAKAFSALRLSRCLSSIEDKGDTDTWYDAAGHLRQIILMYHEGLPLHEVYAKQFTTLKGTFGFTIDYANEVNCSTTLPSWLNHSKQMQSVYDLEYRRSSTRRIGDGLLFQVTGYTEYASREQKALVRASMTMQEGQTLLACLPTGGGKSLIGQLPAFYETKGGRIYGGVAGGGTTLVIVPTVALAIDQNRSSREYFKDARDEEHRPQAYYGGLDKDTKQIIYAGVRNGTIPLLYTSPEAILNGPLYSIILDAAKENRVNRLVIDEAHIVVDWGGAFRTDFQLLSVFRKKLMEASGGKLKTILLSATLTDVATSTLCKLFSEDNHLIEFRSDALRFEPIYFLDQPENHDQRKQRILELIPLLPRPLILYVNSVKSATEWMNSIQECGFSSVITFTGDTLSDERERILKRWNENKLDMVVATSAFGMGVDKSDVRTVIHCDIPESINRFYQEVGRGGRDGFASISLLSAIRQDESNYTNNSAVLTVNNMIERWEKMRQVAKEFTGDSFWVDTNARPYHLRNQETGNHNAGWNETTVLFLYRYGLIDIVDIRKREEDERRQLLVKMINIEVLSDRELLNQTLEPLRKREKDRFRYEFNNMKNMISNAEDECFGISFQDSYPYASETCGGCPACHRKQVTPFQYSTMTVASTPSVNQDANIDGILKQYLGSYKDVLLYTNKMSTKDLIVGAINSMVNARVQMIVIPKLLNVDRDHFIQNIPVETQVSYSIIEIEELKKDSDMYMLSGPIAIVYPELRTEGDWVYRWAGNYQTQNSNNSVIHIAPKGYIIESEGKQLLELIDGSLCNIEQILIRAEDDEDWL
ncbi:protein DpdF [Bacillus sp. 165]|uniref:protein DpdF n=1 Tax=Bacillus sp. 165 TaxID=1529117 RepID=UPI001ADA8D2B|nr:protein DpdF [Bacillus sp. 165]MBO9128582.1 ATP-dependent DNA helicase RecQ [Bacillus sp. 165]